MLIGLINEKNVHSYTLGIWSDRGESLEQALYRDRSIAFSPWVEELYYKLTETLRTQTPVPARLKEAAIRRALCRSVSPYELDKQEAVARAAGLTDAELVVIETPHLAWGSETGPELSALLRYIDEFSVGRFVQKESFETLQKR